MGSSILTYDGDFSNDNFEMASGFVTFKEMDKPSKDEQKDQQEAEEIKAKKINKNKILIRVMTGDGSSSVNSNPLSLIHDLRPDLVWEYVGHETQGKMIVSFKMVLKIGVKQFTGEGKTKKLAKYSAARSALSELYGINLPDLCPGQTKTLIINAEESLLLDQSIANMIGYEIFIKAKSIFDLLAETKKWSVLAGIVLRKDDDPNWLDIICITTGTKCVKGDCLSMTGSVVHDTHAEVLARRCFIHYLYKQLTNIMDFNFQDRPEFILERKDDGYGFKLKEGIKVHLFISTAPCGDARVFSPKEENEIDANPNRLSRGLLRAKIECGEGTIPVKRERATLTWDGVLQGHQRLQFMSCSDKIALWNVVGIQGSLLSHFIEPIYLESVVLQSLFNYDHLVRALHRRLNLNFMSDSLKKVTFPYKVNTNKVSRAQVKDQEMSRQVAKSPNYAINWIKGDEIPEVISSDTGKTHKDEKTSRLAKQTFFTTFRTLLGRNLPKFVSSPLSGLIPTIYRDAKTSSQIYQVNKLHAIQAFSEQNLGDWIQVPAEVDLFGT